MGKPNVLQTSTCSNVGFMELNPSLTTVSCQARQQDRTLTLHESNRKPWSAQGNTISLVSSVLSSSSGTLGHHLSDGRTDGRQPGWNPHHPPDTKIPMFRSLVSRLRTAECSSDRTCLRSGFRDACFDHRGGAQQMDQTNQKQKKLFFMPINQLKMFGQKHCHCNH